MRLVAVALALLLGLAVGVSVLTAQAERYDYLGPLCAHTWTGPGFDWWTGEPHGRVYDCDGRLVKEEAPPELAGRRSVPLPVSLGLSALAAMAILAISGFRVGVRRLRTPTS